MGQNALESFFLSIWEILIRQILPEPRPLLHSIEIQLYARLYNMANQVAQGLLF